LSCGEEIANRKLVGSKANPPYQFKSKIRDAITINDKPASEITITSYTNLNQTFPDKIELRLGD
jgi:hypothetical protein